MKYAIISDIHGNIIALKEALRLMGVRDDDIDRMSKNQSNMSLYHLAGDSIVVNVLMAIFKQLY